uniref:Uncharacterized protein n=1 Tax=Leersia perrieri TaxID=77586 RepID=A0A0D9WK20_9ORYZ
MASLVSQPRRSIQMYWARRNNYHRLGSPSRHLRVARLGGAGAGARRKDSRGMSWRLRAARVLLIMSPLRLLARARDAYVEARLQGSSRRSGGGDFERRMMEHIYRMVVTPELPGAAAAAAVA